MQRALQECDQEMIPTAKKNQNKTKQKQNPSDVFRVLQKYILKKSFIPWKTDLNHIGENIYKTKAFPSYGPLLSCKHIFVMVIA